MRKIKVYLESLMMDTPLEAWTEGGTWNGWATPYFEQAAAHAIMKLHKQQHGDATAWYDAQRDEFCFLLPGDEEPECYAAATVDVASSPLKLYPIGAGSWIWDAADTTNGVPG